MTPERELACLMSLPLTFGMVDELMKCPTCGENTPGQPRIFQTWYASPGIVQLDSSTVTPPDTEFSLEGPRRQTIMVTWMRCANAQCHEVVIWVSESTREFMGGVPAKRNESQWIAYPHGAGVVPTVDPLVKSELIQDYREAHLVLEVSPRLAAVMARSIVEDLLADAGYKGYLTAQIDKYLKDPNSPSAVKELLEPLRALGDWGAHPFKDDKGDRLPVDRAVIEWALDAIGRLFDHFVIGPERDRQAIAAIHKLTADAKRTPLRGPSP